MTLLTDHHTARADSDLDYQNRILVDVSRTFALTIPQLPGRLRTVVGNAYLLCRLADTIEDSEVLTLAEKRHFYDLFGAVLSGRCAAESFAADLAPCLGGSVIPGEVDLVRNTPRVIHVFQTFTEAEQGALQRCVRIMAEGMEAFQKGRYSDGLPNLAYLDAYCYHVAGVVGEMLTELFCAYSPAIAERREALMQRAVSFGQGLQMTNILKDIHEDKQREMCWLPKDVFQNEGFELCDLSNGPGDKRFHKGLRMLAGMAHGHLENALDYTLLIPNNETGIRKFCIWAISMAVLTLRRIHGNPAYRSGAEVKITRNSVRVTMLTTTMIVRSDPLLRLGMKVSSLGLPKIRVEAQLGDSVRHPGPAATPDRVHPLP
ncbi:MAG: hypothetical protein AMXMBFR84_21180 [Candidatus Hydrogenedentota bacterium]